MYSFLQMREIPRDSISDGPRSRGTRMPERRDRRDDTMRDLMRDSMRDPMRNTTGQSWREKTDSIQNSPRDLPRRDEK